MNDERGTEAEWKILLQGYMHIVYTWNEEKSSFISVLKLEEMVLLCFSAVIVP